MGSDDSCVFKNGSGSGAGFWVQICTSFISALGQRDPVVTSLLVSGHRVDCPVALVFMVSVTFVTDAVYVQGRNSATWLPVVKSDM